MRYGAHAGASACAVLECCRLLVVRANDGRVMQRVGGLFVAPLISVPSLLLYH